MRKQLLGTMGFVIALSLLLMPVALLMRQDTLLDAKQRAVMQALEVQKAHEKQAPFAPVQPMMDIEAVWALEDARTESETPLVMQMQRMGGDVLGYDAASDTFYCTLGMDCGDDWPEISLSARGAEGVQITWIDDYTYDSCADAIAQGYRYELMAYTQEKYAYFGVVFTGLPIVTLHAQGEITDEDVAARVQAASGGTYAPIDSAAVVHLRGGGFKKAIDKQSYRIELHGVGANGKEEKRMESLMGMRADSDWLLLANAQDETAVRNKIAWDIWNEWHAEGEGLMHQQSELVEVFVDDAYVGIYQLMERVREEEELMRAGGNLETDGVVRLIAKGNPSRKPVASDLPGVMNCLEYRYEGNGNAERLFALSQDYVKLISFRGDVLDDEAFTDLALKRIDVRNMMEYMLFFHALTLRDNTYNNIYIYICRQPDGGYTYLHAPWDLDLSFWVPEPDEVNPIYWPNMDMQLPIRMLNLNVGNCRAVFWQLWEEKRATILSDEAMSQRFADMENRINDSGAYLRESEKWYGQASALNLTEMAYYHGQCLERLRMTMESTWPLQQ